MAFFHHNTIRKYTLALLDFFNNLEVQYLNKNEELVSKNIPIHYKIKEKEMLLTQTEEQILTGNLNVLPRGALELTSLSADTNRQTSKNLKINQVRLQEYQEFQYNCVAYSFDYSLKILCRGMSEACQIVEEIAPKFNPNIAIDIYDSENADNPTRIPVQLSSISIDPEGFEEKSMNILTVNVELKLYGYLYQPIKSMPLIKQLKMNTMTPKRETEILEFVVKDGIPQYAPIHTYKSPIEVGKKELLFLEAISLVKNNDEIIVIYDTNSKATPIVEFVSDDYKLSNKVEYSELSAKTKILGLKNENVDKSITAIISLNDLSTSISKVF